MDVGLADLNREAFDAACPAAAADRALARWLTSRRAPARQPAELLDDPVFQENLQQDLVRLSLAGSVAAGQMVAVDAHGTRVHWRQVVSVEPAGDWTFLQPLPGATSVLIPRDVLSAYRAATVALARRSPE